LSISHLGKLLHLTPAEVRVALQGTRSILNMPKSDADAVVPYHASFGDFVQDSSRSEGYFSSLDEQHGIIMQKCIQLVTTVMEHPRFDEKQSNAMLYACRHWCYHLASSLASPARLESIRSQVQLLESFVCKIEQQFLRQWLYSLNCLYKSRHLVVAIRDWLQEIYQQFKVCILYNSYFCYKYN
jgi:hypothetical protein